MGADPLDALLERLSGGDAAAAEQAFLAYEPYLRMVVRRLLPSRLRAKFDSVDVVQSVWADVLSNWRDSNFQFTNADQLRAFLVKVTKNRFIDRCRQFRTATNLEDRLDPVHPEESLPPTAEPRPSEVAQADELWRRMLELCPPAHHELLWLKRQGHSLGEIAERTGMHESSVRRILYDLARRLAAAQQGTEPPDEA